MDADPGNPFFALFAILGFAVVFPLFWCAIVFVIAAVGGWRDLAGRFQTLDPPPTSAELFGNTRLGWSSYRGVLRLGWEQDGMLHMSVLGIFKFGHPNLRIPAEAIREERKSGILGERVVLDLGGIADLTVRASDWDGLRK